MWGCRLGLDHSAFDEHLHAAVHAESADGTLTALLRWAATSQHHSQALVHVRAPRACDMGMDLALAFV